MATRGTTPGSDRSDRDGVLASETRPARQGRSIICSSHQPAGSPGSSLAHLLPVARSSTMDPRCEHRAVVKRAVGSTDALRLCLLAPKWSPIRTSSATTRPTSRMTSVRSHRRRCRHRSATMRCVGQVWLPSSDCSAGRGSLFASPCRTGKPC
jgi:hypothetical protein